VPKIVKIDKFFQVIDRRLRECKFLTEYTYKHHILKAHSYHSFSIIVASLRINSIYSHYFRKSRSVGNRFI